MSALSSTQPLERGARTYVAGHRGMVGSALWAKLEQAGFNNLVGRSSEELDLRDQAKTAAFFAAQEPRYVILAAAKVGGIGANSASPVQFITDNLRIQLNVMGAALETGVERLLFLGSSCIYPKYAPQPIAESALLTGHLEPTNDAYAIAKIAGIIQVQSVRRQYGRRWISVMPANLYGPGDNFSGEGSHVVPAMIRRFVEARRTGQQEVTNWGTGTPRRELLHVDDMASACLFLLDNYDGDSHVNVGTGSDLTIKELSDVVAEAAGYVGAVNWDASKPDGTPRKLLDVRLLESLGWRATIPVERGITEAVEWYEANRERVRT